MPEPARPPGTTRGRRNTPPHASVRAEAPPAGVTSALTRPELLRAFPWSGPDEPDWAPLVEREWLVTNGLGGYASGTVAGATTRRYHGLLIAAEPPPLGRTLTLVDLLETIRLEDGAEIRLGGEEHPDRLDLHGARYLQEFRLEWGLPSWLYRVGGVALERRVALLWGTNTLLVRYRLPGGGRLGLRLRPTVRFRSHDLPVSAALEVGYTQAADAHGVRVTGIEGFPDLRMHLSRGAVYHPDVLVLPEFLYRVEASRGYGAVGDNWSPGFWDIDLDGTAEIALLASTAEWRDLPLAASASELFEEEVERRRRLTEIALPAARTGPAAELVLAADQFIIEPVREHQRLRGRERSVIAGYHWFTDWGRDTMISLEGLTLMTGREDEARAILRTFAHYTRDGLIPNLFPEGDDEGVYHTADATLWYFHAVDRYLKRTGDHETLEDLLPTFRDIIDAHIRGTRFNIGMDPADGLLRQGADGYQLTWMDAKVENWVVTPRRGKAVEINALWYNALALMERWERAAGDTFRADELGGLALRARASFNRRFWIAKGGYLFDVVDGEDGDDPSIRPNQIFAVSLPHAVLDESRWASVLDVVRERLLTPVGLRSLDPAHPDYRRTYHGNLWERDAAYHQGTVWAWLIGPFVDAWLKVNPGDYATASGFLEGLVAHLDEFGVGSVAEIFDAEEPHRPRGCIAQAWSVAELLRCLILTEVQSGE